MLSKKLFNWMHKFALFAIVFASLAPSISHALAAQQGINSFAQEVCTQDGRTITIQVVTTKGQQLETGLETAVQTSSPVTVSLHMNHCPFCNAGVADIVIPSRNPAYTLFLIQQETAQQFNNQVSFVPTTIHSAHLTRGPPATSL